MSGPIIVVLSGCFMNKMETDIVVPMKPKFYRRYVDDTYRRRKLNIPDELFDKMNTYHPNIKLTIEINPIKFLDSHITRKDKNTMSCMVYPKDSKLPFHWSSAVPKSYKRNIILGELHRAKRFSSNFNLELIRIRSKFVNSGYPTRFVESVINTFHAEKKSN